MSGTEMVDCAALGGEHKAITVSARRRQPILLATAVVFLIGVAFVGFKAATAAAVYFIWWLSAKALANRVGRPEDKQKADTLYRLYGFAEIVPAIFSLYLSATVSGIIGSLLVFVLSLVIFFYFYSWPRSLILALIFSAAGFGVWPASRALSNIAPSSVKNGPFIVNTLLLLVLFFSLAYLSRVTGESYKTANNYIGRLLTKERRLRRQLKKAEGRGVDLRLQLEKIIAEKTAQVRIRNSELEILNAVAVTMGNSLSLENILNQTINQVIKIFPISLLEITVVDEPSVNAAAVVRKNIIVERRRGADANQVSRRYINQIIKTGRSLEVELGAASPRPRFIGPDFQRSEGMVVIPVKSKKRILGCIAVISDKAHYIAAEDVNLLTSIANIIGPAIENSRLYNRIKKLSDTDDVTGLYNHRFITRRLEMEFRRARRYHSVFSLMMIDVDGLKRINDDYGHLAGDVALRRISLALISACRSTDVVGRYGGDEFLLILPEADTNQGLMVVERVLAKVSQLNLADKIGVKDLKLTVSIGLASYHQGQRHLRDIISAADQNLYQAKLAGGNQCVWSRRQGKSKSTANQEFPLGA